MKSPALRLLMVALILAGSGILPDFRLDVRCGRTVREGGDGAAAYSRASRCWCRVTENLSGPRVLASPTSSCRCRSSPRPLFQSGSVGKQFTATAIMMLVEEGKIGLDDSITKYFPEAPADVEAGYGSSSAEPHRRLHRLSERISISAKTIAKTNFSKSWRRFRWPFRRARTGATAISDI